MMCNNTIADVHDTIRGLNRDFRIDINKRIILVTGEIEELLLEEISTKTDIIQSYSTRKQLKEPITWQLSTFGGDVYEMFALIDYMRLSPIKTNVNVIGKAMSAGAMILVSATGIRSASKYSTIMFHEASGFNYGKISDQKAGLLHTESLEDWVAEILAAKTKKSVKWWKEKQKTDTFFTPTEAKDVGAIDLII